MNDNAMIEVSNLTKRYAGRTAVAGISFTVARGEIVGLLGPNGAGKSTTMRILACYLPATSGTVRVAGFDVFHQSAEVRRRIGYMPENNPLYLEMRVREYLKFRARLKGLGWRRSRERVSTVMEQCGLTDVGRRIIGQLSKGYRQRVGMADALVHDPEMIILDEPTIGLDPHRIRAVRQLIKGLARARAVPDFDAYSSRSGNDVQPDAHHVRRQNPCRRHAGKPATARGGEESNHRGTGGPGGRVARVLVASARD